MFLCDCSLLFRNLLLSVFPDIDVHCFGLLVLRLLSGVNYYKTQDLNFEDDDFGFWRMKGRAILSLRYSLRCLCINEVVSRNNGKA